MTEKLSGRIAQDGITARAFRRNGAPIYTTGMDDMDWWNVRLRMGNRITTVPFGMGYGLGGREPTAEDVLSCLLSDASSAGQSFSDWAGDYGYDRNDRSAMRTYRQVCRQTEKLREFLGEKFDAYLYETGE